MNHVGIFNDELADDLAAYVSPNTLFDLIKSQTSENNTIENFYDLLCEVEPYVCNTHGLRRGENTILVLEKFIENLVYADPTTPIVVEDVKQGNIRKKINENVRITSNIPTKTRKNRRIESYIPIKTPIRSDLQKNIGAPIKIENENPNNFVRNNVVRQISFENDPIAYGGKFRHTRRRKSKRLLARKKRSVAL